MQIFLFLEQKFGVVEVILTHLSVHHSVRVFFTHCVIVDTNFQVIFNLKHSYQSMGVRFLSGTYRIKEKGKNVDNRIRQVYLTRRNLKKVQIMHLKLGVCSPRRNLTGLYDSDKVVVASLKY